MTGSVAKIKTALDALTGSSSYLNCRAGADQSKDKDLAAKIEIFNNSSHSVSSEAIVDPASDLRIDVTAFLQGRPMAKQVGDTYTVTVGTVTNQLSLSIGLLATGLQARSYSSRNSVVDGALAANRLVVENGGVRRAGIALLNYAVVGWGGSPAQERLGLSVSAGPTIGLGQTGTSSAFGFFGGVTIRLWDRLFLTPGAHIGQFADFPVGLQNNSTIPTNYGALTPVNRWTTRFGFSLTFRTNDFSALKKPNATTGTTTPVAK